MALIMGAITACVLAASVNAVLSRQDQTLQRMAFTSGAAITSFIANNAAVTAADNATLPPDQRDWLPVQAFVRTAADDPNVSRIMIVDDAGVIRASSLLSDIGQPYRAPAHEPMLERRDSLSIWDASGQTLRFERPIIYAGRAFGRVDVSVKKADLNAAAEQSRLLLAFLSLVTLGAVVTVSYVTARAVVLPIRRLRRALQDAGGGDFDFRISHSRRDEFGELFDGFNQLVATAQARLDSAEADQSGAFAVQRQDTPDTALPTDLFTAAADGDCDRTQITTPIDQSMPTTAQAAPDPGLVKRLRNLKRA
jgi:serine/threonine-protein kinase